jgi:outer membrane protein assembly factor BamB
LGTPSSEFAGGVAVDLIGNAYVTGTTLGKLGDVHYRSHDAYVAKYSSSGDLLWTNQFPDAIGDRGNAITVDSVGNLFLAGADEGGSQEFLAKLDTNGDVVWRQNINYSVVSSHHTQIYEIASDSFGNVYLCGLADGEYHPARGYLA